MGRASRTTVVTTLGVVASLAALLLAGRLTGGALRRAGEPASAATVERTSPQPPLVRKVALSHPVDGVAVADDGGVWIVHHGRLSRVDPRTLLINAFVAERWQVTAVAAGAGAVWASAGRELLRVDPRTAEVVARRAVPPGTAPVAAPGVAAGVWAVCCGADRTLGRPRLTRIDPDSNRVVATIPLPGPADAVGAGLVGVWVRSPGGPIWEVDPARNRLAATVRVPGGLGAGAGSVLVAGGMVLVADPSNGTVHIVDADATGSPKVSSTPPDGTWWATSAGSSGPTATSGWWGSAQTTPGAGRSTRPPGRSARWRPGATRCGWGRRPGCSASTSARCLERQAYSPTEAWECTIFHAPSVRWRTNVRRMSYCWPSARRKVGRSTTQPTSPHSKAWRSPGVMTFPARSQ